MRAKPSESPRRILFLSLGCTNCCSKIRAYWTKVHQIFKSAITEFQRKECWCQFSTTISSGFCTPIDYWLSQWTVDVFIETQRSVVFFSRGHTMHVLSPFISVLCHSDWLFHGESLSTSWLCLSRPCMVFLACVHLALFLALSHSPGNSLVSS